MALTECVECGGKVSTRAEVCIHCGCPVEPPIPQINCPDCGEDFAGSLTACPVCGGPVVVPESSEELSEPPAEQDELTVTEAEPLEVESISSEHELYEDYYPEGQLREKGFKLDGEWDGPYESHYPNGKVRNKGIYEFGRRCGEWVENGNPKTYPPCSGKKVIKRATQPSQQASAGGSGQVSNQGPRADARKPESVATKDEPFNNVVAVAVGAFVFQIARSLGVFDVSMAVYQTSGESASLLVAGLIGLSLFAVPIHLLTKYGKKQSPQVYAGIIALCFAVFVIAVIGN